jgi:hypothetical protein
MALAAAAPPAQVLAEQPPRIEPTLSVAAYSQPWDSSAARHAGFAAGEARIGALVRQGLWDARFEIEALGTNDDDDLDNRVEVRQASVGIGSEVVYGALGRRLTGGAERWGSWASSMSPGERYGSTDGLMARGDFALGDLGLSTAVIFANAIGSSAGASMRAYGDAYGDPFDASRVQGPKSGNAVIAEADARLGVFRFSLWYGRERNRIVTAPSTAAQRAKPDGEIAEKYEDMQASLGLETTAVGAGAWFRRIIRSELRQGLKESDTNVFTTTTVGGGRRREEGGLGLEARVRSSAAVRDYWYAGIGVETARTATDATTAGEQRLEDDRDVRLGTLTAGWRETGFDAAFNVSYASARGEIFSNPKDGSSGDKTRTTLFLRAAFELDGAAAAGIRAAR